MWEGGTLWPMRRNRFSCMFVVIVVLLFFPIIIIIIITICFLSFFLPLLHTRGTVDVIKSVYTITPKWNIISLTILQQATRLSLSMAGLSSLSIMFSTEVIVNLSHAYNFVFSYQPRQNNLQGNKIVTISMKIGK